MLIWGGEEAGFGAPGHAYDVSANAWSPMTLDGTPAPRSGHSAVWTCSELIVWGGRWPPDGEMDTGGRYSP